jgi:hypothetical protein
MKSLSSVRYLAYDLRTYFASSPRDPVLCPECGSRLERTEISASQAVTKSLANATMPEHEFSSLLECTVCKWWAVWESWGDREYWAQDFSSLIVSVHQNVEGESRQNTPWRQALDDEEAYKFELPLPLRLGKIFAGGERKKIPTFQAGDTVRLVSVVITYQPDWSGINIGDNGSQGTVVNFDELFAQYEQQARKKRPADEFALHVRDQDMPEEIGLIRMALDGKGCYAVRIDLVDHGGAGGYFQASKKGVIYVVAACDVVDAGFKPLKGK